MSNSGHHQSRLFHKGCVSVHTCQTAILSHTGAMNSAYWAFSTFQSALHNLSNSFKFSCSIKFFHLVSSVYICLFPWESFSQHTVFISICGKAKKIGLVRNKDAVRYRLNSGCCMTIISPQLREELLPRERTQWHWSKHLKFRPSWIMTVPQRLSFFAQLSKCNLATFGLSTTTIPQSARLPAQQCHLLWKIGRLIRRRAKRPAFL